MSLFTSLYLVGFLIFILMPTSSETCSEHRSFVIAFPYSIPSEVASAERNNISVYDCAELCSKLYSEHCGLFFYNTRTRHCSLYDSYFFCVTLFYSSEVQGYAYIRYQYGPVLRCINGLSIISLLYDSDRWLVIQRRGDKSKYFDRSWNYYENGFGDFNNEYWLGNKYIHFLTNTRSCEMQVDVQSQNGTTGYRRYNHFSIASAADKYRLNIAARSSGNIEDNLYGYLSGLKFSTKDQDNDEARSVNCAQQYEGGWWYASCGSTFLNGRSQWNGFSDKLKRTQMKIRPV